MDHQAFLRLSSSPLSFDLEKAAPPPGVFLTTPPIKVANGREQKYNRCLRSFHPAPCRRDEEGNCHLTGTVWNAVSTCFDESQRVGPVGVIRAINYFERFENTLDSEITQPGCPAN